MSETKSGSTWSDVKEVIERKIKENNIPEDAEVAYMDTGHFLDDASNLDVIYYEDDNAFSVSN